MLEFINSWLINRSLILTVSLYIKQYLSNGISSSMFHLFLNHFTCCDGCDIDTSLVKLNFSELLIQIHLSSKQTHILCILTFLTPGKLLKIIFLGL
uniref:Uncharacterized protein n=1 Tax=Octopus bimaculoides TaxID=37653 RepID=A0A0L8FX39_OCTBM